jgi:DNA-binding NarL/FixJ family response regulator
VKTHIRNILRKLGARNRTQAVAHVLRKGLID